MHFPKACILAAIAYAAIAAPLNGRLSTPEVRSLAKDKTLPLPPPNREIWNWRGEPWVHYAQAEVLDRLYPVNMKNVHIDHDDIITPSLPSDVKIPTPFLPTEDKKTKELYGKAMGAYLTDQNKTQERKDAELKQKWIDVRDFNEKTLCYYSTHAFNLRCSDKQDAKDRRWNIIAFRKKYHKLKNKLIDEMRVEGLVNFGEELIQYLESTNQSIYSKRNHDAVEGALCPAAIR